MMFMGTKVRKKCENSIIWKLININLFCISVDLCYLCMLKIRLMISVEGLCVEFSAKPLFTNASFVVNDRDRIALVGKNGAGKSTLLKILCGMQHPTSGVVSIPNDTSIGYLPGGAESAGRYDGEGKRLRRAFSAVRAMKARIDPMNQQLAERTDYESDDYLALVERFTQEHERYLMMGADNYEAEIERTLVGLGFERTDLERPTE